MAEYTENYSQAACFTGKFFMEAEEEKSYNLLHHLFFYYIL